MSNQGMPRQGEWRRALCESTACAEVRRDGDAIMVRSSLRPDRIVVFTAEEWSAFCRGVASGDFDQI
jgi:hypothetical protein